MDEEYSEGGRLVPRDRMRGKRAGPPGPNSNALTSEGRTLYLTNSGGNPSEESLIVL